MLSDFDVAVGQAIVAKRMFDQGKITEAAYNIALERLLDGFRFGRGPCDLPTGLFECQFCYSCQKPESGWQKFVRWLTRRPPTKDYRTDCWDQYIQRRLADSTKAKELYDSDITHYDPNTEYMRNIHRELFGKSDPYVAWEHGRMMSRVW